MKKCGYVLTQNIESKKTASTKRSPEKPYPPLSFLFLYIITISYQQFLRRTLLILNCFNIKELKEEKYAIQCLRYRTR